MGERALRGGGAAIGVKRMDLLPAKTERELSEGVLALNAKHWLIQVVSERLSASWEVIKGATVERDPVLDDYALTVPRKTATCDCG